MRADDRGGGGRGDRGGAGDRGVRDEGVEGGPVVRDEMRKRIRYGVHAITCRAGLRPRPA